MAMTTMQRPDDDESHERRTSPYEQNESLRAKPFDEENQISQETENDTTIQQGWKSTAEKSKSGKSVAGHCNSLRLHAR